MRKMRLTDILALHTPLRPGMTVAQMLPRIKVDGSGFFDELRARMAGAGCLVPVCVEDGKLLHRHHRVKLAVELGFTVLPITDDLEESGNWMCRTLVLRRRGQFPLP